MSKKSDQVKSGFAALDYLERAEVIKFINEYEASTETKRYSLRESADKALNKSVGPRDTNACACCGK